MKLKLNTNNRDLLPFLIKESKSCYFKNHFQNNLNKLKSTWECIKKLISSKELPNIATSIFLIMVKEKPKHKR